MGFGHRRQAGGTAVLLIELTNTGIVVPVIDKPPKQEFWAPHDSDHQQNKKPSCGKIHS